MGSFDGGIERVRSTVWFIGGVPQQEIVERFDMIDLVRDRGDVLVCAEGAFVFFFFEKVKREKRTCAYRTSNRDLLVPSSCRYDLALLDLLFHLEPDES